jgi:hypothetical protein
MADFTTGRVLRAKLNEPSGTACIDSTGLNSNGTYSGNWTTVAAPAQFGSGEVMRVCDASGDVTFADNSILESSRSMSDTAWVKGTATSGWFATKSDAGFVSGDEWGALNGSQIFVGRPVGPNSQPGSPDFNDDLPHFLCVTVEDVGSGNVVIRMYTDAVLIFTSSSIAWTPTANSDLFRLFSRRGSSHWVGAMYDFIRFNRTLTAADISLGYIMPTRLRRSTNAYLAGAR